MYYSIMFGGLYHEESWVYGGMMFNVSFLLFFLFYNEVDLCT